MDFQKHGHEYGRRQERMNIPGVRVPVHPADQFGHEAGGVERRSRPEHRAQVFAIRAEGFDMVGKGFVFAAMALVLDGIFEQVAVQLPDVVFGEIDRFPVREDRLHGVGVTGGFLLVPGGEGPDLHIRKQFLDLAVGQFCAFDTCRGSDAFNGGDALEAGQPFWRNASDRPPRALELVDFRDQRQDFVGDLQSGGVDCGAHFPIHFHPIRECHVFIRLSIHFHPNKQSRRASFVSPPGGMGP